MSQPDPDLVVLGRSIRELREEHGMSNADLAVAARLTPERLAAIEAGDVDVTYDVIVELAAGIGVRPAQLIRRVADNGG